MGQGAADMEFPYSIVEHQVAQEGVVGNGVGTQVAPGLELIEVVVWQQRLAGEQDRAEPEEGQNDKGQEGEQVGAATT